MRPYLAIIKDSFREARASRVLWLLLLLVGLILIGMAPFGYRRIVSGQIEPRDSIDWFALLNEIESAGKRNAATPAGQIWRTLSPTGQQAIDRFPDSLAKFTPRDNRHFDRALRELNAMLGKPELYDAEAWSKIPLNKEAQRLLEEKQAGELEPHQLRRLNRLLVESAFPRLMKRSAGEHIMFVWGPFDMDFGVALPLTERSVERIVDETVVNLMSLLLGTVGIFVAILVTAPQINLIFEEGSINLLLSKPVSRSLLYLAKFVGSCVFILIVAAFFIGGLSLIAGARFGVWDWRPLACLPLFVFMFMTYYCVSGLASIIWKNNIISIAAAVVFWIMCVSLGLAQNLLEVTYLNSISFAKVVETGGELLAVNETGQVFRWNEEPGAWREVFQLKEATQNSQFMNMMLKPRLLGPLIDEKNDRMLAIRSMGSFRNMGAGSPILYSGQRFDGYAAERGPIAPSGALGMYRTAEGEFLVVAAEGIFRLQGELDASQAPVVLFGVELPFTGSSRPFRAISPKQDFSALPPAAAAFDAATGEIAVYSQGRLSLWRPTEEGHYTAGPSRELVPAENRSALIALGGESLLVMLDDGEIHLLDRRSLSLRFKPYTPRDDVPRTVLTSPSGEHFAVLYHTGYLSLIDPASGEARRAPVGGQGDITAAVFLASGELAVADQAIRVRVYDVTTDRRTRVLAPPLGVLDRAYFWAVKPFYAIFPKPGELDQTARYVLTGERTVPPEETADLVQQQIKLRPWDPIPSTAMFIVIMLALSCYLMERQEF